MIKNGTYRAKAVDAKLGKASTGTEQVGVLFEIVQEGEAQGQRITWYGYFTDATTDRTLESLTHCGWEGEDITDLTGVLKNEVNIVIEAEEGQDGKVRPRVKWVNSGGAQAVAMKTEMNAAEKASFADRIKARQLAKRNGKGEPAGVPEVDTSEVPF